MEAMQKRNQLNEIILCRDHADRFKTGSLHQKSLHNPPKRHSNDQSSDLILEGELLQVVPTQLQQLNMYVNSFHASHSATWETQYRIR
jgi:hypothetical protein